MSGVAMGDDLIRIASNLKHSASQMILEVCISFVSVISFCIGATNLWLIKRNIKPPQKAQDDSIFRDPPRKTGMISVIIATKNESRYIGQTLRNLESTTADKSRVEIIIVDVGSMDSTIEVARASSGAIPVTYIKRRDVGLGGRGTAINDGFAKSVGEFILVLRADSLVPPNYDQILRRELNDTKTLFAAFKFSVDKKAFASTDGPPGLWILLLYFNLRSSLLWLPSAMQGLAMSSHHFESHRFSNDAIMDDASFYSKIRKTCLSENLQFRLLDQPINCSPIRWEAVGVLTWLFVDSFALFLFTNLHFCPDTVYLVCYDFMPRLIRTCFQKL